MTTRKEFIFALISIVIPIAVIAGTSEIVLQFLPVAENPLVMPVTQQDPVFHYAPDRPFVFSIDWNLRLVNHGRVNNAGMVNGQDYRTRGTEPVLAVVGDSYIEAKMVPYKDTLQGQLATALNGRARVYSFAASGAPLSQYLIWGRHAVQEYGARALIINVVSNDFDESHDAFKQYFPGFWIYAPSSDGQLRLRLFEFEVGTIRSLAKFSALARYLLLNLHVKNLVSDWSRLRALVNPGDDAEFVRYAGNTAAAAGKERMEASVAVIDAFFRDLPTVVGLPTEAVMFTMDGFRYPDIAKEGAGTYFDRMRHLFRQAAESRGYEVIDMDPLFFAHFKKHSLRFEDIRDLHWNGTAHGVAADAALHSRLLTRLPSQAAPLSAEESQRGFGVGANSLGMR